MIPTRREFLALGGAAAFPTTAMGPAAANSVQGAKPTMDGANWGRWGPDDQKGAINLITPAKRLEATALVKNGRAISLSRAFTPPQHYLRINERGTGHSVTDYLGFEHHGIAVTHVDALCHMWDREACGTAATRRGRLTPTARGLAISRPSATVSSRAGCCWTCRDTAGCHT